LTDPSLRACEAGVAIHLSFAAEREELDCFAAVTWFMDQLLGVLA
jgi:hypothetical protein